MQIFSVTIEGTSPYSQSRKYEVEKLQGEGLDDYARRTWREHMHVRNGEVFIPPNAIKNGLSEAAKFMGIGIPGRGKATYTKHFEAGVQVTKPVFLGIMADAVTSEKLFLPSDGKRGSGSRVWKYYPFIPVWGGTVEVFVFDETVLQTSKTTGRTVLEDVFTGFGQFIGLGRFRPRNNGYYGVFDVKKFAEATDGFAKAA